MPYKTLKEFIRMEPVSFKPVLRLRKLQKLPASTTTVEEPQQIREQKVKGPETLHEIFVPPSNSTATNLIYASATSVATTTSSTTVEEAHRIRGQNVKGPETLNEVFVPPSQWTETSTVYPSSSSAVTTSTLAVIETSSAKTTTEISNARFSPRGTYVCPDCSEKFPSLNCLYHHLADQHYQQKVEEGQMTQKRSNYSRSRLM